MKRQVAHTVLLEVTLVAVGLLVGFALYALDASGPLSILIGVLSYLLANILKMRLSIHQMEGALRPVDSLEGLCEHCRIAETRLGRNHVFLQWLSLQIGELTEKSRTIADERYYITNDAINMIALYEQAYARSGPFCAFFPEGQMAYVRMPACKVFWKTVWDFRRAGRITQVRRVFIVSSKTRKSAEFQRLVRLHDVLGWDAFWIDPQTLHIAVRGQLSGSSAVAPVDSFAIYNEMVVCEASHMADNRMQVCFVVKKAVVDAYVKLFDAACKHAHPIPRTPEFGKAVDFDKAYDEFNAQR